MLAFHLAFGCHFGFCADTPKTGDVCGLVVGVTGGPIQGAHVYALSTESANPGRHQEVLTDSKGEFLLKNVHDGPNEIRAYAPDIGYPDNLFAFFQTAPVPVIVLKPGAAVTGVVVHLGPKAGTLAGEVVDKMTGKPLPSASVTLSWADRPSSMSVHLSTRMAASRLAFRRIRFW